MIEIWKDIKDYEGFYQVSNLGRIRSLTRNVKQHSSSIQTKRGKILSLAIDRGGYVFCALSKNNNLKTYKVHRLVANSFIPNPLDRKEINHKDCDKTNNVVWNLEWSTRSHNINHAISNGRLKYPVGESCYNSKLTNNQRIEMYEQRTRGMLLKDLSAKYGVSISVASKICQDHYISKIS